MEREEAEGVGQQRAVKRQRPFGDSSLGVLAQIAVTGATTFRSGGVPAFAIFSYFGD
jgi:hypothetical protein